MTDPTGSSALVDAVAWVQATLLGTVATTVAIIVVASIGLMMLSGRLDWRRGATTIGGCFLIFGASSIAGGIRSASGAIAEPTDLRLADPPIYAPPPPAPPLPAPAPKVYDPYAGASVPN